MLHLLFTEQDVHDLKLHVTEQENVHFEPKFTGWSIRPLADCQVCSAVVRLGGTEVEWGGRRAVHLPLPFYVPDASIFASRAPVSPTFNQNMNQKN